MHIDRESACAHWRGEDAYDANRRSEIEKALNDYRCEKVACNRQGYLKQYEGNPKIHEVLQGALTRIWGDVWKKEISDRDTLDALCLKPE